MLALDELRTIMRTCGVELGIDLDGDIVDTPIDDLGYDSLARLQIAALIQQQTQVALSDDAVLNVRTPRELLGLVNGRVGVG